MYLESRKSKKKEKQVSEYNFRPADLGFMETNHKERPPKDVFRRHSVLKLDNMSIND
jgi:hypothetical protein